MPWKPTRRLDSPHRPCQECGYSPAEFSDPADCIECAQTIQDELVHAEDRWESGDFDLGLVDEIRAAIPAWVEREPDPRIASIARFAYAAQVFADQVGAGEGLLSRRYYMQAAEALSVLADEHAAEKDRRRSGTKAERLFCKAEMLVRMLNGL